jgi:outer membrane lipoprotein-sorting protein
VKITLTALLLAASALPGASLDVVLQKMDANAAAYAGVVGKIKRTQHTAVINEDTVDSGTVVIKRVKSKSAMMLMEILEPEKNKRTLAYADKKIQNYLPKINTVQIFDFAKFDAAITQGLLIGFGTTSKDLRAAYDMKALADETIAGAKTTRLDLTPKSANMRENIKKIELWIDVAAGYPRQVKVHESGGNYWLFAYSDIQLLPNIPDERVRLKLPANVKKEYPQK